MPASLQELQSFKRPLVATAIISKSAGDGWPAVANAHIVFTSPQNLQSSKSTSAATAIAPKSAGGAWPD
eukprot:759676-Karenia_brevis.AAC.1